MVNKITIILLLAVTVLSCEATLEEDALFDGPEREDNNQFYFLDAELRYQELDTTLYLQHFVDLDPGTSPGLNETLIYEAGTTTAIYSVFNAGSTMLDSGSINPAQLEAWQNEFGFNYGRVSYAGLGFCFFLPPQDNEAAAVAFEDMLQAGNSLAFGTNPGQIEVGYYKNSPGFADADFQGVVTQNVSNDNGFFLIEEAWPAVDINGQKGYQLLLSFECALYKQYTLETAAELAGSAVIFVPEP